MAKAASRNYKPCPLDTSRICLDPSQLQVVELLAQNVHELWARQRMSEGWIPGPTRDDAKRMHPCLVPFDQLDHTEKAYDRMIVEETLKALIQMGFRISKT